MKSLESSETNESKIILEKNIYITNDFIYITIIFL